LSYWIPSFHQSFIPDLLDPRHVRQRQRKYSDAPELKMTQEFLSGWSGAGSDSGGGWSGLKTNPGPGDDNGRHGVKNAGDLANGAPRQPGGFFSATEMDVSLEQLPIRKRYLKSHSGSWDGGSSASSGEGVLSVSSPGGNFTNAPLQQVLEDKNALSGGDLDARLRAGVIRHSSDPKRCLAYYYTNKNPC